MAMTPVCAFTNCSTVEAPPPPPPLRFSRMLIYLWSPADSRITLHLLHLVQMSPAAPLMFQQNVSNSAEIFFKNLSVAAGFTHRPALVVVTLFRVFSEGRHPLPPPRLLSPTLPPPVPHSLQQLTSRPACVNAPCLDRKLFFSFGS